jgi:peptidoglycan/LPS O-acetylase OafA/YrhL
MLLQSNMHFCNHSSNHLSYGLGRCPGPFSVQGISKRGKGLGKTSSGAKVRHLVYLDGLRGLLALYVLTHHLFESIPKGDPAIHRLASLFQYGHEAVGFFIVLSGYSLMLPVSLSPNAAIRGGFGGYLFRRARRILPPYFGALVLSIAIKAIVSRVETSGRRTFNPEELSWTGITSHALLIHTWVRDQAFSINKALWSVATEWHIYFLFPTILLPVWRRVGSAALILAAFTIGTAPLVLLPSGNYLLAACPWYVGLFALSMTGRWSRRRLAARRSSTRWLSSRSSS